MAEHVQQSMPAHLKKYGGNTYIPEHAQAEMAQHLESSLPSHMKQYAGAYLQQNVVEPSLTRRSAPRTPVEPAAAPQAPVVSPTVFTPGQPAAITPDNPASAPSPAQGPAPAENPNPDQAYSFITNPAQAPKQSLLSRIPGNGSLPIRIGLIAGGLIVLLLIFVILRGIFGGSSNLDSFVTVTQQQQELIHLATEASQQEGLSAANQNVAATMQVSLKTSQTATIQYMANNKKKINAKQLNLKVSAATDEQLTNAAAAGTYNQTFHDIMAAKLKAYSGTLSQTYNQTTGPKGRELLQDNYRQSLLLQTQLNNPAN